MDAPEGRYTVFEGVAWAVEQLEEVEVVAQVHQGRRLLGTESRVASVDDVFEIGRRDFVGRDVEAENLQGEVGI